VRHRAERRSEIDANYFSSRRGLSHFKEKLWCKPPA
jgi:hypothetical protein